jgi:DNA-binding NtrC family response regulator
MTALTRPTLLCVDDEEFILTALQRLFKQDYDVKTASSGAEALEILRNQHIHVVISDQRMPEMGGVDLLRHARNLSPSTMRILLTGYADLSATIDSVNKGEVFRFITKPWKNDILRDSVKLAASAALISYGEANMPLPLFAEDQDDGTVDILVIDDDVEFFEFAVKADDSKHRLFHASCVEDALNILEICPAIGVIISEGRAGLDDVTILLKLLKAERPSIVTLVVSGFADANVIIKLINEGQIVRFLNKPVDAHTLSEAVARAESMHRRLKGSTASVARVQVNRGAPIVAVSTPVETAESTTSEFAKTQPLKTVADGAEQHDAEHPISVTALSGPSPIEPVVVPLRQTWLERVRALFRGMQ